MPLTMITPGNTEVIQRITGKEETKHFLESLGFVSGSAVTVVSTLGGNIIVNIKETRVALGRDMANRIMV